MVDLDLFFEKCIKAAFEAEKKEYKKEDVKWFYIVIKNQQLLFDVKTPYQNVTNRINYWINSIVSKKLGLEVAGDYMLTNGLEVSFVYEKIVANNKAYYINKYENPEEVERGTVLENFRYEKLILTYFDITLEELSTNKAKYRLPKISWREFKRLYKKGIGEFEKMLITDRSSNVVIL